jgi:two-component system, chemotaxis family, sensor kinase CheA
VFLSELDERLGAFDSDVLALETPGDAAHRADVLTRLFRGAHSLKGAAASVGAAAIELTCQELEDLLAALRDETIELIPEHIERFFTSTNTLREAGRILAGNAAPQSAPASASASANASAPRAAHVRVGADSTLRVAADALEDLLEKSGELLAAHHRTNDVYRDVIDAGATVGRLHERHLGGSDAQKRQRDELHELHRSLERIAASMQLERERLARASGDLDAGIRAMRMIPFGSACEGLERVVRDAAAATGKTVSLAIDGADVGVDRVTLERLRDPLMHLVRNAVDHGIEPPDERVRNGKPARGTIRLSVRPKGGHFELAVTDDGRGLDLTTLRERMRERGLEFDAGDDLARAVFLPGMSTATSVTSLSGRGVGLDVVRTEVEGLRGTVEVTSTAGRGAQFLITLPLSFTTLRVVEFTSGDQHFGIVVPAIARVLRVIDENLAFVEGRTMLLFNGAAMPFVPLHAALGIPPSAAAERGRIALVLRRGDQSIAIAVDALIDEREVHLRPLGPRLTALPHISGASVGTDGGIALILRSSVVFESALAYARALHEAPAGNGSAAGPAAPAKRVLLVDDSITTRALERSILEAAGFAVVTAADGRAAWKLLNESTVDLVVSDVDMPEMNGFQLVEAIRGSAAMRELPVILVTGRENETDRKRGLDAGADAYIVKSSFRQEELLDAIGALA